MTKSASLNEINKLQKRMSATWDGRTLLTTPDGHNTDYTPKP